MRVSYTGSKIKIKNSVLNRHLPCAYHTRIEEDARLHGDEFRLVNLQKAHRRNELVQHTLAIARVEIPEISELGNYSISGRSLAKP